MLSIGSWGRREATVGFLLVLILGSSVAIGRVPKAHGEETYHLYGAGWGHGIGMSQYGALGQAKEGRSHTDILSHYYQGTGVSSYALPSEIRVGLLQEQSVVGFSGSGQPYSVTAGSLSWVATGGEWVIEPTPSGIRVRQPSGAVSEVGTGSAVVHGFEDSGALITLSQNGRTYGRGRIEIVRVSEMSLHVVAVMDYERYLYGLGEMPSSWPQEALRAQAVAARTYALYKHLTSGDRRFGCDCTVFASTRDQAYVGWSKETGPYADEWRSAVDSTAGKVVTYGGQPILALYHSSSGGRTENNEDVWGGTPLPYLRSVDDRWSQSPDNPYASWAVSFSASELAGRLGMDSVSSLDLSRRTAGGGLAWAVVGGSKDGAPSLVWFRGDRFRAALGLRSIKVFSQPRPGFDEWILIHNPNESPAQVDLSVERSGASPAVFRYVLPPSSRTTIKINDLVPPGEVAVALSSDLPVAAERAMYFSYRGWSDGHSSGGIPVPARRWYLAEGYETDDFDTYIEVFNPGDEGGTVRLTLMRADGHVRAIDVSVGPHWRYTLGVGSVEGFQNAEFSTLVEASVPVVVERSMYFAYRSPVEGDVREGGTAAPAAPGASTRWYFAEGYSGPGFDTWVLLQNPNDSSVVATVRFYTEGGGTAVQTVSMPPRTRRTVLASSVPGVAGRSHAISVAATAPIAAERAEYFRYFRGYRGGSAAEPVSQGLPRWYLPEGYTGPGFDTWLLLSNPSTETVSVRAKFMLEGGSVIERVVSLPPLSRTTLDLRPIVGEAAVSTLVESTDGKSFVAERASYFVYRSSTGWVAEGGSASIGLATLSTRWYFAEGYLA